MDSFLSGRGKKLFCMALFVSFSGGIKHYQDK